MKFLVDNAISPFVAEGLKDLGFDALHVRDLGIQHAEDAVIFQAAFDDGSIVIIEPSRIRIRALPLH